VRDLVFTTEDEPMRISRWLFATALISALLVGWTGTLAADYTTEGTPHATEAPTIFVRQDPTLGTILTDPKGMTLYLFTKDTAPGESSCYDKCAQNWPPFTAEEPFSLPFGVQGELTTVQRTDGTTQVAYNGIPLYYFAGDAAPGDVNGQNVGDVWFVLGPDAQFGVVATPEPMTSGSMGTPQAGGDVEVTILDGDVESSVTDFKVGETYTFNVTNNGEIEHEIVLEKAGAIDEPLEGDGGEAEVEGLKSGDSGSFTVTFSEAGNYQLACHIDGHYEAGTVLTIRVSE
jgi:predicted lipoprotein with Yx(FWY)xxD motif/plastocyanin